METINEEVRVGAPNVPSMSGRTRYARAERRYGIGFGGLALLLFVLLWSRSVSEPLICWVIATSLTAFVAFGFDKLSAIAHWLRVPEWVLIGLALAGGTIGAVLAMLVFRHKTAKRSFQWRFWLAVALQALLAGSYIALVRYF